MTFLYPRAVSRYQMGLMAGTTCLHHPAVQNVAPTHEYELNFLKTLLVEPRKTVLGYFNLKLPQSLRSDTICLLCRRPKQHKTLTNLVIIAFRTLRCTNERQGNCTKDVDRMTRKSARHGHLTQGCRPCLASMRKSLHGREPDYVPTSVLGARLTGR